MNSNDDLDALAVQLAAIKLVKERVAAYEAEVKAALRDGLGAGGRRYAAVDGAEVATITVTKPSKPSLKVMDEDMFARYVAKARPEAIVPRVRESDKKQILSAAAQTGEIPDGVDFGGPGEPSTSARFTDEQRENLIAALESGALDLRALVQLTASPEPEAQQQ